MYKIAISPSQQMANQYTGVKTTEGIEMEKLGKLCHDYHISKGGESLLFDSKGIYWKERPKASKDFGASVYLVLHSNAGGGKGTETLHAKNSPNSKAVSTLINERLTAYFEGYGFENTRYSPVIETNFFEATEAAKLKMAHSYVEVNFHDNAKIAQFMVKNWGDIAKVIVDAVWEFRGWKQKPLKEGFARSIANVNLRKGSSTKEKLIETIKKGEEAKVIGLEGQWLKVVYNGKTGFTHRNYWEVTEETLKALEKPAEKPAKKPAETPTEVKQDPINGPHTNADGQELWFRTIAGSHRTRKAAEDQLEELKKLGFENAWLLAARIDKK